MAQRITACLRYAWYGTPASRAARRTRSSRGFRHRKRGTDGHAGVLFEYGQLPFGLGLLLGLELGAADRLVALVGGRQS